MSDTTLITFLTDYGLENKFLGVCRGVMARIAPRSRVLDVTHLVPQGDVRHGAEVFRQAIPYLPAGVHLAIVDPGVGTSRRAVVLVAGAHLFVGPDNGLLIPATDELGGVDEAYVLSNTRYWLDDVSHTFHGRDVFAPVAAHLASGVAPTETGPAVGVDELVRLPEPLRRWDGDLFHGEVMIKDRFGNLQTSLDSDQLKTAQIMEGSTIEVTTSGGTRSVPFVYTFGSVAAGEPLAHIDSANRLALAVNLGSAASIFSLAEGDEFSLRLGA